MADYLVFSFFTSPAGVTRVDLDTFTRHSYLGFSAALHEWDIEWIAILNNDLYLASHTNNPGKIIKVDLLSFTKTGVLDLLLGERDVFGLAISGNYLYVTTTLPSIVRVDLTTFTRDAALNLNFATPSSLHIEGNFLYVLHLIDPAVVTKINLTTFTIDSELTVSGERNFTSGIIFAGFLYCCQVRNPGRVTKIDLATFTVDSTLVLAVGENRAESLAISGNYLYVGLHTTRGEQDPNPIVAKIDLTTFTETLDSPIFNPIPLLNAPIWALSAIGGYLYGGVYLYPAWIIKIDIGTFTVSDTLTLPVNDEECISRNFVKQTLVVTPFVINKAYALSREEL